MKGYQFTVNMVAKITQTLTQWGCPVSDCKPDEELSAYDSYTVSIILSCITIQREFKIYTCSCMIYSPSYGH